MNCRASCYSEAVLPLKKIYAAGLLALLWAVPGWFQPVLAQTNDAADDYVVQVWDTDTGLPHSSVTTIAQTPDGYLWVGTQHGGLARFDGERFVNFHPGNTPELKSIEIQKLVVDGNGTLWIGNVEGGLISYRDGRFHFERQSSETPPSWLDHVLFTTSNRVVLASLFAWVYEVRTLDGTNFWSTARPADSIASSAACYDRDGTIWYRTTNSQLGRLSGGQFSVLARPPGLRSPRINALQTDAEGRLWVGTDTELARWDGQAFVDMTPTNGEPDLAVRQLALCHDGSVWVHTENQLRKCSGRRWTVEARPWAAGFRPQLPVFTEFGLYADSRGEAWVTQNGQGVWHVDNDGRAIHLTETSGLPNNYVRCWFEDREHNIWVGLVGGGLARIRQRVFHERWPTTGAHIAPKTVCEDTNGTLWFGTTGNQLLRLRDGVFDMLLLDQSPSSDTTVFPADNNCLWVGGVQSGLLVLTNGEFIRPFSSQRIGTVARALYQDRAGGLWIGSEYGLYYWDGTQLKRFWTNENFTAAYVLAITQDPAGDVWVGTAIGELRRYHDGKFENYRPKDSLTDEATVAAAAAADPVRGIGRGTLSAGGERFWALYADEDGAIWVGTLGGGLLRFKQGQFTRYRPADGLPSENVSQILEDDRGQLWLGTRAGVVRVSKSALNEFAAGAAKSIACVGYGKFDGLPAVECSGGSQPACWHGRDGRLWFTTVKGAVWVNPAVLRSNHLPPPLSIEEVLVDGRPITAAAGGGESTAPPPALRVAAGRHYFEFKFSALSFTSPDKVRFKWRMAGLEEAWVDGGGRRSVSYPYVPPGNYRFEVLACNNDGRWSETPASVRLTVLPFFWQHWWFRAAAVIFLCGLAGGFYSARISRLQALERLRLRIARDLHDEVGANLGSISLLAQMMEQTPSSADAAQVRGIARQTVDTLRDIIWFIDPTHDKLSDLVLRLEETARVMLATVPYKFHQSGDFHAVSLSLPFRRNVPPVFKETLHNVLKHSHATEVQITVQREGEQFQFSVSDNGVGFDPAHKSSGNGLRNFRKRAAEIGGSVAVQTGPGRGATIIFTAPLTQTRDWFKRER